MKIKNKKLLRLIPCFYFPIVVFIFDLIIGSFGAYDAFSWVDIPMHFLGGASIAYASISVLKALNKEIIFKERLLKIFVVLGFVCIAAIFWEFGEFLSDYFFNTAMQGTLIDTMGDLFFGLFGGLVMILFRKV